MKSSFLARLPAPPQNLVLLVVLLNLFVAVQAAKFSVNGPVLTVTLKDPDTGVAPTGPFGEATVAEAFAAASARPRSTKSSASSTRKWIDLATLRPNLYWSVQSNSPPLPNWFPSWTSMRANVGYQYEELKTLPSFVEGDLKFRSERLNTELQIRPSYEFKAKRSNMVLQVSKGAAFLMAKFSVNHNKARGGINDAMERDDPDLEGIPAVNAASSSLELLKASYDIQFPAGSQVRNLRITPSLDVVKQEPSCVFESTTGGSGRSKVILKLNYDNPTLGVVHALDERNTIAPEISLYNAKIIYKWKVNLNAAGTSSIQTRVDPLSAIDVTWTDTSAADGGRWVTDFRLPLAGTTIQALASDVRVRRQFNF